MGIFKTKRIFISESIFNGFDIEKLSTINSFQGRKKYCSQFLTRLGEGTTRIVYDLGDKVLKLAKNDAGVVQNSQECDIGQTDYFDIVTKVYKCDMDNDTYVFSEKMLRRAVNKDFLDYYGYSFENIKQFCRSVGLPNYRPNDKSVIDNMWDDNLGNELGTLIDGHSVAWGDMIRPSSWGVVNRNGENVPVLVDYGHMSKF